MRKLILGLITVLTVNISFGQQTVKLDYCKCQDQIDQITPDLNGKYERKCNGVLIEKGEFINGLKNGEWITYSRNGKLIRRLNYDNGLLNGNVELYYVNGNQKVTGQFEKGNKVGKWTYYTEKGKILSEGSFNNNKPIDTWTIYDKKGKKPVVQYDYSTSTYINKSTASFHNPGDIVQNGNTEEWYILNYPNRKSNTKTEPLGGYQFANDMFVELVEVPLDYWDTYIHYEYIATYDISKDNGVTLKIEPIKMGEGNNLPSYPFVIITNPDSMIKKIEHTYLSIKLLEWKIKEALSLMPPWVFAEETEVKVNIPYVINKIER